MTAAQQEHDLRMQNQVAAGLMPIIHLGLNVPVFHATPSKNLEKLIFGSTRCHRKGCQRQCFPAKSEGDLQGSPRSAEMGAKQSNSRGLSPEAAAAQSHKHDLSHPA